MEDVETVLRFFAFSKNRYLEMRKRIKRIPIRVNERIQWIKQRRVKCNARVFWRNNEIDKRIFWDALAKYRFDEENNDYVLMSKFNISVFDALSVSVADEIVINKRELKGKSKRRISKTV